MSKDKLNDSRGHIEEWLRRHKEASDIAPRVKQYKEILDWEAKTLKNRPLEASSLSTSYIDRQSDRLYNELQVKLPLPPKIDTNIFTEVGSLTASSTSAVVVYVSAMSRLESQVAIEYAANALNELNKIQHQHRFPSDIRDLVKEVFPGQEERFNSANMAYDKYVASLGELSTAASEMRNFLDGLKGDLLTKAKRHEGDNVTFDIVLERLYKGKDSFIDVDEQFTQRSDIYGELSGLTKRRHTAPRNEVMALWMRILNYTFIILTPLRNMND